MFGLVALVLVPDGLLRRDAEAECLGDDSVLDFRRAWRSSAALMITSRKPVYAALWFAMVTFSTCGLFLLQSAPFLAAATIIVYAGAIIVTFLFVMMLAQQAGATTYDQRAREPLLAAVAAFLLLGALIYVLQTAYTDQEDSDAVQAWKADLLRLEDAIGSVDRAQSMLSRKAEITEVEKAFFLDGRDERTTKS